MLISSKSSPPGSLQTIFSRGVLFAKDLISLSGAYPIIDVRSPCEFAQGHIPGAVNVPLFNDDQRSVVGTLYKQVNRSSAFLKGLEFVGPKLPFFVQSAEKIKKENRLLVHCWRGGERSRSFSWLLRSAGIESAVLLGGYKGWRKFVRTAFAEKCKVIILSGMTGSGKTEVLHELAQRGEQVLDLEGLASHRGSAFGHIGMPRQPTTEQFENDTFTLWHKFDFSRRVWIEDESRMIGSAYINDALFAQMQTAPIVKINAPLAVRSRRLARIYGGAGKRDLSRAVEAISKRLGGEASAAALLAIEEGRTADAAAKLLGYYDRCYSYTLEKRSSSITAVEAGEQHGIAALTDAVLRQAPYL